MTPQQLIRGRMPTVPVTHQGRNVALLALGRLVVGVVRLSIPDPLVLILRHGRSNTKSMMKSEIGKRQQENGKWGEH